MAVRLAAFAISTAEHGWPNPFAARIADALAVLLMLVVASLGSP